MQLIKNNPYRIIGILVGTSAKDQDRHVKRLKQFLIAQQELQDDFSFPVLGFHERTIDSVNDAASKLNLDSDKINAALFWFYNGNKISDEPAFDSLKGSDIKATKEIWSKLTASGEITKRNSSAFHNLSSLLLCEAINEPLINDNVLEQAISLKIKFLESDFINDLIALATDQTFKISKRDLQFFFLNQIQLAVDKIGGISTVRFVEIIKKQKFSEKDDFFKILTDKKIEQIEKRVTDSKKRRKSSPSTADKTGKKLLKEINVDLSAIKDISEEHILKYASISDKVSQELLQCGIDYFSKYKDSNKDPSKISMELFLLAKNYAFGNISKQRCQETIFSLQEWIGQKPKRDKQKLIEDDIQFVLSKLDIGKKSNIDLISIKNVHVSLSDISDTLSDNYFEVICRRIEVAENIINTCKPKIINIKNSLGKTDTYYLEISSAIVHKSIRIIISEVNDAQNCFRRYQDHGGREGEWNRSNGKKNDDILSRINRPIKISFEESHFVSLSELSTIVNKAYKVILSMQSIDMSSDLNQQYLENKKTLEDLINQISPKNDNSDTNSFKENSTKGIFWRFLLLLVFLLVLIGIGVIISKYFEDGILFVVFGFQIIVFLIVAVSKIRGWIKK